MENHILNRIEKLSAQERKLVLYKLKDLINNRGAYSSSENPKKLVAYVKSTNGFDRTIFRSYLKERLPDYMIPSSFRLINKVPLLPNGKIDKSSLRKLPIAKEVDRSIQKPRTAIERQLVEIWEEVLNFSPIGLKDNFFEIGGDSMTSIRMFWLIENKMLNKLPPTTLFNHPTIEGIVKKIIENEVVNRTDWKYLVPFRTKGNKQPIFCIHGGEGHVLFYKLLPEYLDQDRPVYLVQPKGINTKDAMHTSIEQMSKDYLSEVMQIQRKGPYNLLFYCCSALVVEITNQLQQMGEKANTIIIDSSPKAIEHLPHRNQIERFNLVIKKISKYPFMTIKASLIYRYRQYLEPYYIWLTRDEVAHRLMKIRNQLQKVQNQYQWQKFNAKCTLIMAKNEHKHLIDKDLASWKFWCESEIKVLYNSGNHFNLFDEPHVKILGKNVEEVCY